jgi:hypothetical protein
MSPVTAQQIGQKPGAGRAARRLSGWLARPGTLGLKRLSMLLRYGSLLSAILSASCLHAEPVQLAQQEQLYMDAMNSISEGRTNDASDVLTRMIEQEPQHAGAWLDLAIIQCELGREAEAERLFQMIESRFSPPPGIREVIASHRLRGCKGWEPRERISVLLGRGIDDNVNQGASNPNFSIGNGSSRVDLQLLPEFLPQSDHFTFLAAEYARDLNSYGTTAFAQLRSRVNDSLSRYDTTSLRTGVEHPWKLGEWGFRGSGSVGWLTLGSALYQKQGQLQARIAPPLALPDRFRINFLTGLSRVQYVKLTDYDSTTTEVAGILAYQGNATEVQATAGKLSDRGASGRPGGDREGWFAGIQGSRYLRGGIRADLGWTRQQWLSDSVYSPGLIEQVRRQDTQIWRAAVAVPLKPHHTINIEWRHVRNNENISIFQYNSQLIQVSWQWEKF